MSASAIWLQLSLWTGRSERARFFPSVFSIHEWNQLLGSHCVFVGGNRIPLSSWKPFSGYQCCWAALRQKRPATVVQEFSSTDFGGRIEARCKVPPLPRGLRCGDSCSMEAGRARARPLERLKIGQLFRISVSARKDPFAMSTGQWQPAAADHAKRRSASRIPNRGIDTQSIGGTVSTNTTD